MICPHFLHPYSHSFFIHPPWAWKIQVLWNSFPLEYYHWLNCNLAASCKMSNILDMPELSKTFWWASLSIYACFDTLYSYVLLLHVYEKCRQRRHIFYFLMFFSKMKCIVFSAQIVVTFHFFFHLVGIFS